MPARGHKLGRFTLIGELGAGGMGATYLAVWRGPHQVEQRVCIKTLNEEGRAIPGHLELFQREAALCASLRHPGIAGVLEVDDERGFIAYEYIDGCDLRTLMGQRFTPTLVVYVLAQVALALEHAHQRRQAGEPSPVVHRDISPSNIMIDRWGNVKVIDFGIGKAVREASSGVVKGKLPYMSPEQASALELDGRTDQYSLGVVGYELIAGVRPNDGGDERETYARILTGGHVPLAEAAPDVPAGLAAVIERMLSTQREQRFDTMADVVDGLVPFTPPLNTYKVLAERVRAVAEPHTVMTEAGEPVLVPAGQRESRPSAPDALRPRAVTPSQVVADTRTYPSPGSLDGQAPALGGRTDALPVPDPAGSPPALGHAGKPRGLRPVAMAVGGVAAVAGLFWVLAPGTLQPAPAAVVERPTPAPGAAQARETSASAATAEGVTTDTAPVGTVSNGMVMAVPSAPDTPVAEPTVPASPRLAPSRPISRGAAAPELAGLPNGAGAARRSAPPRPDAPRAGKTAREGRAPASLRVGVFPSGNVWVDGEPRGAAPLTVELHPGRHTIGVGSARPTVTRTVRVRSGQEQSLVIDLSKASAEGQR